MTGTGERLAMHQRVDRVLSRFGTGIERATRVDFAQSNEVWLAEQVVVRVGQLERSSLAREVALAPAIPAQVGYPELLDHGVIDGYAWMASARVPGDNLGTVWPRLDQPARAAALADLWERLQNLQAADLEAARRAGCTWTPYYALEPEKARRQLAALVDDGALEEATGKRLDRLLTEAFEAISLVPVALAHTDASPSNTVWTPTRQAIPVDFEFACVAPIDLDLENLFRNLYFHSDPDTSARLADLAADVLERPGAGARLRGYAILRDLWALRLWLKQADDLSDLPEWAPVRHLHEHASGTSWLRTIC